MTDRPSTTDDTYRRDYLKGAGGLAAAGTVTFAGCLGDGDDVNADDADADDDDADADDDDADATGTLATQVTDQPGDIADFESCIVTIDGIWVKPRNDDEPADADADETESDETESDETDDDDVDSDSDDADDESDVDDANDETEGDEDEPDEPDEDDVDQGEGREYHELDEPQEADLVDLQGENTQLLGEHELAVREYEFLQLDVSDVDGTLEDGETAEVETPGNAPLQFTERFEIREDERTTFVADFTPVRRGQSGSYVLQPVARGTKVLYGDEEYELDDEDGDGSNDEVSDGNESDGDGPDGQDDHQADADGSESAGDSA